MSNNRYLALDAFRGLTIALMILVNTPGSWSAVYSPLLHANWNGVTPTDLIFPFFLFIIGSALYFSFAKSNFELSASAVFRILKRAAIIFGLGLLLNAYGHSGALSDLRIMGVLQRLGIAYGIAAILVLALKPSQLIGLAATLLLGYWGLLLLAPAGEAFSLDNNVVRQVDMLLLGENHLWQGKGLAFEPEGLLSTIPALVNVFIGFEATKWLSRSPNKAKSIAQLVLAAVLLIAIALIWHTVLPMNKSLWTSSYVLFSSGCALLVLAFFIWLVDIKQHKRLVGPLLVYGTNPMFIYVLSWVWVTTYYFISLSDHKGDNTNLYDYLYQMLADAMPAALASLVFAVAHVILFWFISNVLYKKNILIKV